MITESGENPPTTETAKVARFVGVDESGEHIVLRAAGSQFLLPIDAALRSAVRSAHRSAPATPSSPLRAGGVEPIPQPAVLRETGPALSPREIQARIRAGQQATEVAASANVELEMVRRYEGPVLAERAFIVERARETPVARTAEAPLLGDLVLDRLAARGVERSQTKWDAYRKSGAPWTVTATFEAGERQRQATWSFDLQAGTVHALDDEARWLSEVTEPRDSPIPTRRLAAVRDWVYDVDADGGVVPIDVPDDADEVVADQDDGLGDPTAELLDELSNRRGRRQPVDIADDGFDFEIFGDVPAAHPPHSRPEEAVDAEILQLPDSPVAPVELAEPPAPAAPAAPAAPVAPVEKAAPAAPAAEPEADPAADAKPKSERRSTKGKRSSVPSWDEIVFGARPE